MKQGNAALGVIVVLVLLGGMMLATSLVGKQQVTRPMASNNSCNVPSWIGVSAGWGGPYAVASFPGTGSMQAAASYIIPGSNKLVSSYWRGNQGFTRTFNINNGVVDWNSGSWSAPIAITSLPGQGDMQAVSNYIHPIIVSGKIKSETRVVVQW